MFQPEIRWWMSPLCIAAWLRSFGRCVSAGGDWRLAVGGPPRAVLQHCRVSLDIQGCQGADGFASCPYVHVVLEQIDVHCQAQQLADGADRHPTHARQSHHQRLKQQGEAAALACSRHLNLMHAAAFAVLIRALRATNPRHLRVNQRPVLEEVQMLPVAFQTIVDRLIRGRAPRTRQPLGP